MIIDDIRNWRKYRELSAIAAIFETLESGKFNDQPEGRYESELPGAFFLIQRYRTAAREGKFEAHRKYVDVQYIISGHEIIGYGSTDNLTTAREYDENDDASFYESDGRMSRLSLTDGMFAVFFPQDAHMPKLIADAQSDVVKIVVKIPVRYFAQQLK